MLAEISIEYAEQETLPKLKRLNIGKANCDEFAISFNFSMSSFDSIDNIVDSFYHKLELASSIAIPLKTSRRTNVLFYMSSNSIHLENKLKTALKNIQSAEKISRLRGELSISLNNDKKHFVEKSKVWLTNDAYKLMRQITKQPALPEKMVYMEKEVFGYKSIAECFNNYFASVFVQDDSEVVVPFIQKPETFFDDIQFSKAALSEEIKYIRSGANSFDGISPKFLKSINGAFWARVACRADVIGHQNNEMKYLQNNFQQSVAGIREDLQKEITAFKSEMLNNIEEIKLTLKNSRYENEPPKLAENLRANADLTSQSERENKIIVFGVPEKTSDTMITVLDRISHDKKSVEELAQKIGIQTLNIENIFRLGKFNSTQTRPRPLVVKLSNTWNCRIMVMSNSKLKADNIFMKLFFIKK